ncbi:MAG: cation efflux family transporter [Planctomycetota bacterium]|nr:MAG: cation efflux family transporter [Planctomycetota bacterium]
MSHHQNPVKSIIYALLANLGVAIAKSIAAVLTKSGSMFAEAIHSFADCGNQILLLIGIKNAKKPPTPNHPLGYGKATYFWSFIVAIILFSMGGVFSIYEGIHRLHSNQLMENPAIAISVLIFSVLLEGAALFGVLKEIKTVRGDKSLWKWFRESRQSELIVVFGEDSAAMLGLSSALIAVIATTITGNPIYDACGSIAIGVLLIIVSIFIGIEVKNLLIGESVTPERQEEIKGFLDNYEGIDDVLNLITLQLGNDVMVAVKAKMDSTLSAIELIQNINRCEHDMKEKFPDIKWIFFEPDIAN